MKLIMNKTAISVFVSQGDISNKEIEQLIHFKISQFESYGAFIKPANNGYIRIVGGEVFDNHLNPLIRFVQESLPKRKVWFQCEGSGNISVVFSDGEDLLYRMDGTIVRGIATIDLYREQYPALDKACRERNSDIVVLKSQDNHLFIRQFWNDKTILMIDGYIQEDNRKEKGPYILFPYGTEISENPKENE